MRFFRSKLSLLVIGFSLIAVLGGFLQAGDEVKKQLGKLVRTAPTPQGADFLVCKEKCERSKPTRFLECLQKCQTDSKVVDSEVVALMRPMGGVSVGFSCDPFEDHCSCSGYFDCKILDKSGCCSKPVDTCTSTGGGPETCTCEKSPQCGL